MKWAVAMALGVILCGCAAPPPVAAGRPIVLDPALVRECALIQQQIAEQQRTAAFGGVMATPLVQAAVQINTYNVINGLHARAALFGCV